MGIEIRTRVDSGQDIDQLVDFERRHGVFDDSDYNQPSGGDGLEAFKSSWIESNGIRMHVLEAGAGPLVILCHGFPELGYSWRHQLGALADAGYHVVAPDQRGYGQTDRPSDP